MKRWRLLSLFGVFLIGCAAAGTGGASGSLGYGFMVPGPEVATVLRVRATDSIPELQRRTSSVPTVVETAISNEVASGNWKDACTRRFGNSTGYAVIFYRSCDPAAGPEADPVVIVGFAPDGHVLGRVRWNGPSTVTLLSPARRF